MKLCCIVLLRLGLKGWNILERLEISRGRVYQMGIQIYDQISIITNCSKVKLRHVFSLGLGLKVVKIGWNVAKVGVFHVVFLGFGLKESKITLNIMKVGVHSYLPNAHLNLWSNFNSKKLVKNETLSCGFTKIGVKGGENISKRHGSWSARLSIKRASKSMIKFQFWEIG